MEKRQGNLDSSSVFMVATQWSNSLRIFKDSSNYILQTHSWGSRCPACKENNARVSNKLKSVSMRQFKCTILHLWPERVLARLVKYQLRPSTESNLLTGPEEEVGPTTFFCLCLLQMIKQAKMYLL